MKNELKLPMTGLSGEINFDQNGYREGGSYFGISSVPPTSPSHVTLLQPSTWILEDIISVMEAKPGTIVVTDYDIATSSILTKSELISIANQTKAAGCHDHLMNILTHDPFTQKAFNYYFKENNLPNAILVPNQNGFGVTFLCVHDQEEQTKAEVKREAEPFTSSLRIACTPGGKYSAPIKCFRSHFNLRQKRSTFDPYAGYDNVNSGWDSHNVQLARDDSVGNMYYQQPPPTYYYPSSSYGESSTYGSLAT